jgi:hypothetical protein
VSPSPSAPLTRKDGKVVVIDITSAISPSVTITHTQIVGYIMTSSYTDVALIETIFKVGPEKTATGAKPGTTYIVDFPGPNTPVTGDPVLRNLVRTVTMTFSTAIYMICPDTHVKVLIGWVEWDCVTTTRYNKNGIVEWNITVVGPIRWRRTD